MSGKGVAGALPLLPPDWRDHPVKGLGRHGGETLPCFLLQLKALAGSNCREGKLTSQAAEAPCRFVLASRHPSEGTWLLHQWHLR